MNRAFRILKICCKIDYRLIFVKRNYRFGWLFSENRQDQDACGLMLLMGNGVKPYTDTTYKSSRAWTLPTKVDSSTALAVKHDYRLVLAEILEKKCLIPQASVLNLFINQISAANYLSLVA